MTAINPDALPQHPLALTCRNPEELTLRVWSCTYKKTWLAFDVGIAPGSGDSYDKWYPRTISGWTGVTVSRGIERLPSGFEIELTEPMESVSDLIVQPGDYCEVYLGDDKVITGYIDTYNPSYSSRQHIVRVTGRSKCQDMVDCSVYPAGLQMKSSNLLDVAKAVCAPYGISVTLAPGSDQGAPFPQIVAMVGQTPFEILDGLCKTRSLLFFDDADGNLVISKIGDVPAASGFKEGINVLSAQAVYRQDVRYRLYEAYPTSLDIFSDTGDVSWLIGFVVDPTIQRFRYRAIMNEVWVNGQSQAMKLANWELARRFGRSFQVSLLTDSWRDSAGALYAPNTLVSIDLPGLKLKPQTWLISNVIYRRDDSGTTCELQIMPPDAFRPLPVPWFPLPADTLTKR